MARTTERRGPRRGMIAAVVASVAVIGTVAGFAITSAGYESQEVPRVETSVWVTRDDGRYGRVNADLAELDTVRSVDDPSAVAQSGAQGVLFSGGLRERWTIDPASPADLVDTGDAEGGTGEEIAATPTPAGTREVVGAGGYVLYRTDTGQVSLGTLDSEHFTMIDPYVAEEGDDEAGAADAAADAEAAAGEAADAEVDEVYSASAATVDADGRVAMYSAADGAVSRYDATTASFSDPVAVDPAPAADARLELAMVAGRWILVEPGAGRAWIEGVDDVVELDVDAEALLQESSLTGDRALIADGSGLVSVDLGSGASERELEASGTPAAPVLVGGDATAAWLSDQGGTMWTRSGGERELEAPGEILGQASAVAPVLRTNGDRAVLNEPGTGLLWTVPDGRMIPLEEWSVEDDTEQEEGVILVEDVPEQKPPVAVGDTFGVRSGQLVALPVLLNDHDPNRSDVLTVAAGSVGGIDPAFGEVTTVGHSQSLAVRVAATSGSATFPYAVSDGAASSDPATVTLNVVPDDQNSAPEWCAVEQCHQVWPSPQLRPGGTAIVPALDGWVDPDGDAFVLSDARAIDPAAPVAVVARADGRVAVRHTDPNAGDATVAVAIVVTDSHGASTEKTIEFRISGSSSVEAGGVAVTAGTGENVAVEVAEHVTGGSGSYRLVDAVDPLGGSTGLIVAPNASAGTVELSAAEVGEYTVTYTVADTVTQAEESATIRLSVVDRSAPLSIAPITTFVRPGEDTRVDVLSAVQNSTGRVLLLSEASSSTGDLGVGIVGAEQLRVAISGGVAPAGEPALVGRVRVVVTDGAGAAVVGSVDVFLAPVAVGAPPIARPDTVTVRAGQLTDIHVLANDVSPRGARLVVGHDVVGSGADGELAFTSGDAVRYIAPSKIGTYELTYSVALESDPTMTDYATVTVTVLPAGANRPPKPPALAARVLSGQSVEIPVPSLGIDPDGDRVVLSGIGQPPAGSGTASIGAEGDTIVYRAPVGGVSGGQLAFDYTVRDGDGAEQTALVRVGVLAAELADAAPVTFSDYVRATRGAATGVTVSPLSNDRDPALGELELVEVVPNAPPGSTEYDRLAGLVDGATNLEEGHVVLAAGDVAGTNSYLYTARSVATSSTAQGLIVFNVSEQAAADHPVVTDTVVTARNRGEFERDGLDVVTGHVEWATGDLSTLRLELWGSSTRYRVDGWRISGRMPDEGDLVPFRLSTEDGAVETYGILRIPAFDDLPVQLRSSVTPVQVGEEQAKTFDVGEMLDLADGERVEYGDGQYPVQRQNSTCAPTGSTKAEYRAGREAPWSDICLVPVRLLGQDRWSQVAVPIDVQPKDPQAQLTAISRTVAPGATEQIALYDAMTSWEGGREGDRSKLAYDVSFGGSAFTMTGGGDQISFEARADAVPGTRETATVSLPAFGGASATITLVVGVAPPDSPRGATITRECTVTAGPCTIQVAGVGGEYDPFAGKTGAGLTLASIGSGGGGVTCDVASVGTSGQQSVVATFKAGTEAFGGTCVVPFTVRDAQGRTGPGTLTIDVQGYPQRPASISTSGYTGSSVTLEVALGDAAKAHPAVNAVRIYRDGRDTGADCSPAIATLYRCVVSGLQNGAEVRFTARAVNQVGESAETSAVTTWAYQQPQITEAVPVPVYDQRSTSTNNAVVELTIRSSDDTRQFRIAERNLTLQRQGAVSTYRIDVSPGPQLLTIIPISQYRPPIEGSSDGASTAVGVTAAGAPWFERSIVASALDDNKSIQISGDSVATNGSDRVVDKVYLAWRNGQEPRCEAAADGSLSVSGGNAMRSATSTITGLDDFEWYRVKVCASNGYGATQSNTVDVLTYASAPPPSGTATYEVSTTAVQGGDGVWRYGLASAPSVSPPSSKFHLEYNLYGDWRNDFELRADSTPWDVRVRACRWQYTNCTGETAVGWAGAPTVVEVVLPSNACYDNVDDARNAVRVSTAANGSKNVEVVPGAANADGSIPVTVTVRFSDDFRNLSPVTGTTTICAPPPPDPGPTDPPTEPTDPADPPTSP
ncbi:Ig-like domain-containing protein [Agromyces sp. LHK192]|uniref:Ig-like domain-containing protein n=1 Tax=Agromyces sp. LHK192 TaxID=2498704 RepID=UPI000FD6C44E|nr:Ig-like domain-containing protein [Agromyces sp. LHK192]